MQRGKESMILGTARIPLRRCLLLFEEMGCFYNSKRTGTIQALK